MAKKQTVVSPKNTPADPQDLLCMVKDQKKINVHPTQVDAWEKQGWRIEE